MPDNVDPELLQPAGCFVTLHEAETHHLRGCIGRIQSPEPLIKSVQETAAGALEDPRFTGRRIGLDDLRSLEIDISVLSPLEPCADMMDFDPVEHGIYLVFGQRSGLFLPQVGAGDGVDARAIAGSAVQ